MTKICNSNNSVPSTQLIPIRYSNIFCLDRIAARQQPASDNLTVIAASAYRLVIVLEASSNLNFTQLGYNTKFSGATCAPVHSFTRKPKLPTQMEQIHDQPVTQISRNLFQEYWWLDIVTNGAWKKITARTKMGELSLIFGLRSRYGFLQEIYSPPLSPFSGLYIDAKKPLSQTEQYKLLDTAIPIILKQLPRHGRFKLNMPPEFNWWSPFYWAGYNQHTRYTYILSNIKNHESCWNGFNTNTKRNIRKADKNIVISHCPDTSTLYALFTKTMEFQGNRPGYPATLIEKLYAEIKHRKVGTVLTGYDAESKPHCSQLLVWDNRYAYYLSGGTDPELRSSGAMPKLMWHAIKHASQYVDTFNFEGSMQKGIDNFLRGFGGVATPYYSIGKGLLSGKIT